MAVEVLEAIAGHYGSWDLGAAAAYLNQLGVFSSYDAAQAAVYSNPSYWMQIAQKSPLDVIETFSVKSVTGGAAQAASSTTQTALELATSSDLAATTSEISSGTVAIADTSAGAGTSFGLKALLNADVGILSAAMAPILGVSIGANLYQENPELWTKISQTLLPFCYDDTTMAPFWAGVDALGNWECSVAREIVDALKDLFEEEHIGTLVENQVISSDVDNPLVWIELYDGMEHNGLTLVRLSGTGTMRVACGPNNSYYAVSEGVATFRWYDPVSHGYGETYKTINSYTKDGLSCFFSVGSGNAILSELVSSSANQTQAALACWSMLYGISRAISGYPVGTSEWTGDQVTTIPSGDPIVASDGTLIDTVPISLPFNIPENWKAGQPVPSQDPTEQPDPTATTDASKQVSPYLAPLPYPDVSVSPFPETQAEPQLNPSNPTPPKTTYIDPVPVPPVPTGESPIPGVPTTPLPFSSNVGLITVYHPTPAELYSFEAWLWVTYADATIDKIWNNPFDGVITLFELYCTPTDVGNRNIHCGFLDSGINSAIISRYTEIDCGSIGVPEWYGNYLDYSPYTKAHIYLPFIGIQELNPDDIVGHGVNVTYRIDEYNGSCIAMITVAKHTVVNGEDVEYSNLMYQFSGNCSVELPLSGGSQASIKSGMMMADASQSSAALSIGANLLGGLGSALMGSLGGVASAVGGIASAAGAAQMNRLSNMLSGKSTVQKSGSFGASHGAMGVKTPFITITRPKQVQVADYEKLYGYPAHKMVTLGSCTGFVRCREIHVISATATDEEKTMIETLFKMGVYMTE